MNESVRKMKTIKREERDNFCVENDNEPVESFIRRLTEKSEAMRSKHPGAIVSLTWEADYDYTDMDIVARWEEIRPETDAEMSRRIKATKSKKERKRLEEEAIREREMAELRRLSEKYGAAASS